ncbi:MAG: hypothetical protein KGH79_02930 [Patescibacteria group bacterium]|nr:hypothetical protein [Patescibacteria group bacterium]
MNTKALTYSFGAVLLAAAVLAVFASALSVRADTPPTLTTTVVSGSNAAVTSAPIGTSVQASAVVASSSASVAPTGTVTFNLYNNTACTGTPTTQSGVALVAGVAQSSTTTVPASGLSYLVNYNGDASNTPVTGACAAVTPTASNTSITTALSTTTSVYAGSIVNDTATLANATNDATGTVAYNVYTNNICTTGAQSGGSVIVANALVPNSNTILFNTPGTYYWQAAYSGDQHNAAATSSCGGEVLTVLATSTPPATVLGAISGTVFNDLNANNTLDSGEPGLPGFVVRLHQGSTIGGTVLNTAATDAGGHYSFGNLALGAYFVEEQPQPSFTRTTDNMAVVLGTSSASASINFANISTATSTGNDKDHDEDNDGEHGKGFGQSISDFIKSLFHNGHDNGNHFGQIKNGGNGDNDDKPNVSTRAAIRSEVNASVRGDDRGRD